MITIGGLICPIKVQGYPLRFLLPLPANVQVNKILPKPVQILALYYTCIHAAIPGVSPSALSACLTRSNPESEVISPPSKLTVS